MKKILTLIVISLCLLAGSLTVTATGGVIEARLLAKEKALEVRANKVENQTLWIANATLRTEIKLKLVDIKENGTVLEESVVTQIKTLTETLKTKYAAMKDTKGDIQALTATVPALIQAKDWAALKTTYESLLAIQENRNALLTDINGLLTQINDLLP